jgi:hypothetical protein
MSTFVISAQDINALGQSVASSDTLKNVKTKGGFGASASKTTSSSNKTDIKSASKDTATATLDSLQQEMQTDSISNEDGGSDEIKSKIFYQAEDSIVYDLENKMMFLYQKVNMKYDKVILDADSVDFDWNTFTLFANGMTDSSGNVSGTPVFKDNDKDYKASRMAYNFKSKRGIVYEVFSQEGEAYLQSSKVKKDEFEDWYGLNNKYTTCNLEHPHYYFKAKKVKLRPNKVIVTGPANMYVADIPTPLYIPFGIFPVKQGRRSGIVFPLFGEDARNGFFLRQGGYYWAINDNVSLKALADVYTNGTFGLYPSISYSKRYQYSGNLALAWIRTVPTDPDLPNSSTVNDYRVSWNFNLDPRSSPGNSFSAAVNFLTSSFNKAQRITDNRIFETSFNSNINYQKSFARIPFLSMSLSLSHAQNIATKQFNLTFPVFRVNVSRVSPFRSKVSTGKPKWYESIGITYNFEAKNLLNTYDSLLLRSDIFKSMRFGMQHNVNIDAPFTVAKYFNITPSYRYTERWYFQSVEKKWIPQDLTVINPNGSQNIIPGFNGFLQSDTSYGFYGVRDMDASITLSTKLIGIYNFKGKWLKGIRHIFTPSVSGVYRPDFGTDFWGYQKYVQTDILNQNPLTYSPYDISSQLYGMPSPGMVGALNISLANNFEAKVFSKKDTVKNERKIAPLERFNISGGYNFAAERNKVNPIAINGNIRIWENFGGAFNVVLDPYALDSLGVRTNDFQYNKNKQFLRFQTGNISLNARFQGKSKQADATPVEGFMKGDYVSYDPYLYYDFNIPWSINTSYTFNISSSKTLQGKDTILLTQTLYIDGDVNLTPKWKIGVSSGFDFIAKQPTVTNFRIMRDLHCWELNFNWTAFPVAYQQFLIELRVKASMLKDLKLTRRRSNLDNNF